MKRGSFDIEAFTEAVDLVMESRDVSLRQVARESGASPMAVSRTLAGRTQGDLHTVVALAVWAGLSIDRYITRR